MSAYSSIIVTRPGTAYSPSSVVSHFRNLKMHLKLVFFLSGVLFTVVSYSQPSPSINEFCKQNSFSDWCELKNDEIKLQNSDKELNRIYQALLSSTPDKSKEIWRDAQRKWLMFHKAHCKAVANKGSPSALIQHQNFLQCITSEIDARSKQLASYCESSECSK